MLTIMVIIRSEHVYIIMEPRNVDLQMFAFLGHFRCDPPVDLRLASSNCGGDGRSPMNCGLQVINFSAPEMN
ncbi:Uncharacterized protein HZ326_6372 [Fusarium oxysporum f. sp. albedinis]|nr:Uncharacterized protein HZ326_6372 [Fusarium oxysporum f. sp. albedinis]